MSTVKEQVEDSALQVLKTNSPALFQEIYVLVCQNGQTPKDVDRFIGRRLGLKKGDTVRDTCYLAARSLKRMSAKSRKCPSCGSNGKDDVFCYACHPEKFTGGEG